MRWMVIIAGGRGERFWPVSTDAKPKQFHPIVGGRSLLQETYARVCARGGADRIRIVAEEKLRNLILDQLPGIDESCLVIEPARRNTAPAIGLASALIQAEDPDAVVIVLPADHVVKPEEEFGRALDAAAALAEGGSIVLFGVQPDRPATEYGYVEIGRKVKQEGGLDVHAVKMFREKPSFDQALAFVERGGFLWNAGIFAFRARAMLDAIAEHLPELHKGLEEVGAEAGRGDAAAAARELFSRIEGVSIDYGVMEKSKNILCVIPRFSWDDVGSWSAVARHRSRDREGNVVQGNAVLAGCANNIVIGDRDSVLALVGVHDLVVVKDGDRILICDRAQDQRVREALNAMAKDGNLRRFL